MLCNIYLPCAGTVDRDPICEDVLAELSAGIAKFPDYGLIVAGDFNSPLSDRSTVSALINKFLLDSNLSRCDLSLPCQPDYTFLREMHGRYSKLDFVTYCNVNINSFTVYDSVMNLSDHLPLITGFDCSINLPDKCPPEQPKVKQLRWDHADIIGYNNSTQPYLQSALSLLQQFEVCNSTHDSSVSTAFIEDVYDSIVSALRNCADDFVPKHHVNFYKFWWSQELSCLKEKAVISDRLWKDAGRPRSGPLFSHRSSDKRAYKSAIRRQNTDSVGRYTQSCMMRC